MMIKYSNLKPLVTMRSINNMFTRKHEKYCFQTNELCKTSNGILSVKSIRDFKEFYQLSWKIYKDDPYRVPPFSSEFNDFFLRKNPFWNHADAALFIAYKDDVPVGRIAAIIDYLYCNTIGKNIGFFGFFECINDYQYAKLLLQSAETWLGSKGMDLLLGPVDGRVDNGCGFLCEGFNYPQSLLSSYSKNYYLSFVEQFNMKKSRDQFSYYIDLTKPISAALKEKARRCEESEIKIRKFNRLRTNKELNWWIDLFLETFAAHWGFIPASPEEVRFRFGIKQMRWIVDSDLFLVAELHGEPVGFLWATPEYNQIFKLMDGKLTFFKYIDFIREKKHIKYGKLHMIGIKKELHEKNIGSYLNYNILVEMKKRGYTGAEVGWIDEKNEAAHHAIALAGAKLFKKSRVFEKNIFQD